MKTIFLHKPKHTLFLLIAALGAFFGYSQSTQFPTIGGSKIPDGTNIGLDIGGKQAPPPKSLYNLIFETANLSSNLVENETRPCTSGDVEQKRFIGYFSTGNIELRKSNDSGLFSGLPLEVVGKSTCGYLISLLATDDCGIVNFSLSGSTLPHWKPNVMVRGQDGIYRGIAL